MIDYKLRQQLLQQKQHDSFSRTVSDSIVSLRSDIQKISDELQKKDTRSEVLLDKIGRAVALIFSKIPKATELPKIFNIRGEVSVANPIKEVSINNLDEIQGYLVQFEKRLLKFQTEYGKLNKFDSLSVNNLSELTRHFQSLEKKMGGIAEAISSIPQPEKTTIDLTPLEKRLDDLLITISVIKQQPVVIPRVEKQQQPIVSIPMDQIVQELQALQDVMKNNQTVDGLPVFRKIQEGIQSLVDRPTMTPTPVTNVNINGLSGAYLATDVTIGAIGAALPPNQMANRRSLIIYNNSSQTVYLGGAGVTTSGSNKGFPVLSQSYSPPFDAGQNMILYGVVVSGTAEISVLEMSHEASGR